MKTDEFRTLKEGDIVRHAHGSDTYIVHASFGGRASAVRVADMTNPQEWILVHRANHLRDIPVPEHEPKRAYGL